MNEAIVPCRERFFCVLDYINIQIVCTLIIMRVKFKSNDQNTKDSAGKILIPLPPRNVYLHMLKYHYSLFFNYFSQVFLAFAYLLI